MFLKAHQDVERESVLARRETGHRPVALMTAVVFVVITAKTDDARSPHLGFGAGDLFHHLSDRKRVFTPFLLRNVIKKLFDTCLRRFGLQFSHLVSSCWRHRVVGYLIPNCSRYVSYFSGL